MIGIIGAMKTETDALIARLEGAEKKTIGGCEYVSGRLCGRDVVICTCGIGKVAAAVCAEAMILSYSPSFLINTGVGGALSTELDVFDMVFSRAVVQHDMDTTPIGDPYGLISGIGKVYIEADAEAARIAQKEAETLGLNCMCGVVASGDLFVSRPEERDRILSHFPDAVICEMEGASIGQTAYMNGIPFLVIRSASDRVDGTGSVTYTEFAPAAAQNAVKVVCAFLSAQLPARLL